MENWKRDDWGYEFMMFTVLCPLYNSYGEEGLRAGIEFAYTKNSNWKWEEKTKTIKNPSGNIPYVDKLLRHMRADGVDINLGEKYANVEALSQQQRKKLAKKEVTKKDYNIKAPFYIYPNRYLKTEKSKNVEKKTYQAYPDNTNLFALMAYFGIEFSYNVIKCEDVISIPGMEHFDKQVKKNAVCKAFITDIMTKNGFKSDLYSQLVILHQNNSVNPLVDMCTATKWDGKDRLGELIDCIKVDKEYDEWKKIAIKKWLTQCVAGWDYAEQTPNKMAFSQFDNVLVFTGGQGEKKSAFFHSIMPKDMSDYVIGGIHINPNDKDSVRQATTHGICELGELDGIFKHRDMESMKAFLSKRVDEYRLPYEVNYIKPPRRTSFGGTVNKAAFLKDLTGNRRYFPIAVKHIDYEKLAGIDKHQLWAQMWDIYMQGDTWWIETDKNDKEYQLHQKIIDIHMEDDPLLDGLSEHFDLDDIDNQRDGKLLSTSEILRDYLLLANDRKYVRHINTLLTKKGHTYKNHRNIKKWRLVPVAKLEATRKKLFEM